MASRRELCLAYYRRVGTCIGPAAWATLAVGEVLEVASTGLVSRYGWLESLDIQPDGTTRVVFRMYTAPQMWPQRIGMCFRITDESRIVEAGSLAFEVEEVADSMPESQRGMLTDTDADGIAWLLGAHPSHPAVL